MQQPQVNIVLIQVRGNQVAVLGQVNRPGRFPLETTNPRVSDMLAAAGGATGQGDDVAAEATKLELQAKQQELQLKASAMQQEMAFKSAEHEFRMKELQQKSALAEAKFAMDMKQLQLRAAAPPAQAKPATRPPK